MQELDRLLGSSPAMQVARAKAERILAGRADRLPPVLLQGETGSGKGLLARCLHAGSARRGQAFVEVNCSAIPETLAEAELFGFERGAFTDAQKAKPGLLQLAHEGTLFLDEISLLPPHLQPKLLKALEDRAVRRLGGTRAEPADVWLIAATNEDLAQAVAAQRFRADLYHRLAVVTIALPSLRERGDDLLQLADAFLERTCAEYGLGPKSLTAGARAALQAHSWPGNVRELANTVERGALLAPGDQIEAAALELPAAAAAAGAESSTGMDEVMRRHLCEVLAATGWNVSQTAARLGIARNTVRARMRKYGLHRGARGSAAPAASPTTPAPAAPRRSDAGWQAQMLAFVRVEAAGAGAPLEIAEEKLRGFGGRIEERGPSGLVAVFGLEPLEDAARRATLAALAVARPESPADGGVVAVAVHAAEALVRSGADAPVDHGSKRAAVDVLERIELARPPGERGVLLSAAAAAFVARDFELRPCGPEASLASAPRSGLAMRRAGVPALVGREGEISFLLARLEHALTGRGHVVAVAGEPGIGKSRLLVELRAAAAERARWVDVRCWSHLASVPYAAVVDLARQLAGIDDGDDAGRVAAKLAGAAAPLAFASAQATALLELFGFVDEARAGLLTPEARKQAALTAVRVLACAASRRRPVVLAFEDVHWMDATSAECLAALVDAIASEAVLVLTSHRPGAELRWRGSSLFTQVALVPLTSRQSEALLAGIAGTGGLGREWVRDIVGRAEGNPFFLEELTRSVLHHGEAGLRLPQTISEVLLYRLRLLPPELRRTLEVAAVLGRQFPPSLLERLLPAGHRLAAELAELQKLDLLVVSPGPIEPVVTFKHALTQEAAYGEVAADRRRDLHGAAARLIEEGHAHRRDEVIDILAHHYERSGDAERAVEALAACAARATRGYALEQAIVLLRRALGRSAELPAGVRDAARLDLANRLAHVLCISGQYQQGLELLTAQATLVAELRRADLSSPYHFWLGYINSLLSRHADADAHAREAIALARAAGLAGLEGRARFVLAREAFFRCRFPDGVESGRRAVALLEGAGEPWWLGQAHWVVGINQLFMGQIGPCLDSEAQAASLGEALGDARLKSYARWTAGFAHACAGDGAAAIACCRDAFDQSPDPVNTALARGFLGFAHAAAGDPAAAVAHLERTVDELERFGLRKQGGTFRAFLAEAALAAGDPARAQAEATSALSACSDAEFPFGAAWAERVLGRLAARDRAVQLFEQAAATFERIGAAFERARTLQERQALGA
jgi:transcriptional regulator with AAA-type ATPase domain